MRGKVVIQAVMFILGLYFLITSFQIDTRGFKGDVINQRDYVIILSLLLILLSVGSMIKVYLNRKSIKTSDQQEDTLDVQQTHKTDTEDTEETGLVGKIKKYKIYFSMVLVFLFAYGFAYIGFFVTSFVYVFLITWLIYDLSKKKWLVSLIFSATLNIILFFLFDLISVYLPDAWLF
ncbi:tripartite tricarboxylate transporter TctB family protein [Salipaludibacillus neizhouensis]|nr:tripartite tricarboxylate transporter TctB family protein [Salipaludibacillus neizhouensis]